MRVGGMSRPPQHVTDSHHELAGAEGLRNVVVRRAGAAVEMKPREFDLLALLVKNAGRAFSRDQILQQLWGHDYYGDSRTVDVHVRWLREKIEPDPSKPRRLVTVRGVGYRFDG